MSLNERIQSLSPEQRALLEQKLRGRDTIPRRDPSTPPPLSFAQLRMWFLDQLEPENIAYNSPVALRFEGNLDPRMLETALDLLLERHHTLRSRFPNRDGQPELQHAEARSLRLRREDLHHLPHGERMTEARRMAREDMRRPFNLEVGPLIRTCLYYLDAQLHLLTISAHHIAIDGWSIGVLVRELGEIYAALAAGESPKLPPLPIDYADYAAWQRDWLSGPRLETQLTYWRKQLGGDIPMIELPTDRPRPNAQSFRGARESTMIDGSTTEAARGLARSAGATLFMVLLATLKTLVHRYTGEHEILIGTPIANRRRREIENLVGYIANTLVLRSDLSGDPSYLQLLAKVRETALSAFDHQDIPFERLVEELPNTRDTNRTPFFGITLTLQNAPISAPPIPGLNLDVLRVDNGTAKFDLSLIFVETGQELQVTAEYSSDLYDADTIRRLLGHFKTLLANAINSPKQNISELPMLTDAESNSLRSLPVVGEFPVECLHCSFEKHAARSPESIAIVDGTRRMTYGDLNARANGLARQLLESGVRIETPVALFLDRSAEQIVAILGVLKAGGAYVPLDVQNPEPRLRLILENCGSEVLITSRKVESKVPDTGARLIHIEDSGALDENPNLAIRPENLAYVMYTSGSTGIPKGVLIEHRNVSRLFASTMEHFNYGSDFVVAVFHSYAFDLSIAEIFGALLHGGCAVIVDHITSRSTDMLLDLLESERVTMLIQTPSAFRSLQAVDDGRPLSLRHLIFSGEMLPMSLLCDWVGRRGDEVPALLNLYGPTETTVYVTYRRIRRGDLHGGSMIGGPISDSRCLILDQHRNPVPWGVPGELYLGGPCVGRGYLGQPEKQAEVFIPHLPPWPGIWYKTGDIVRRLNSGEIEYLGREDAQLKIRGFRVETGEIEAAICQLPEFTNAVVVVADDELIAYCVTEPTSRATKEALLKDHLSRRLPHYMIPSILVLLDELPRTVNGKLDRKALQLLEKPEHRPAAPNHVPPRTDAERAVAAIWNEVLQRNDVGLEDDFFRLGGHSLLAAVVIGRMEKVLDRRIPLRLLFETPSISGILRASSDIMPLRPVERIEEGRL